MKPFWLVPFQITYSLRKKRQCLLCGLTLGVQLPFNLGLLWQLVMTYLAMPQHESFSSIQEEQVRRWMSSYESTALAPVDPLITAK